MERGELSEDRRTFDVNFFGIVHLTRLVLAEWLRRAQPGHVAVTSSGAGLAPMATNATYCASKHALQGYFHSLAIELHHKNVRSVTPP